MRKETGKRPRIVYAGTSSLSAEWFMRGQLGYLQEMGFDVSVVTGPGPGLEGTGAREGVETIAVPMERKMAPLADAVSLYRMWRTLRRLRPDISNVGTPKAGLLGGIAAWLNGVPCRVYTLHGLRLETTRGLRRKILWLCERIACACAHRVISVSESVRQEAIALGIVDAERIKVLGSGSCNGVDMERFAPRERLLRRAAELRRSWRIAQDAPILGFVGRFTRDKGIPELVEAYDILRGSFSNLRLLLVGEFEDDDPVPGELRRRIETDPNIIVQGYVGDIESYYQALNVLALPTYREGLPNVILEAHGACKPVVATRATGVVDAVEDGISGIMVSIADSKALAEGCARLLKEPQLAEEMGRAGRSRVMKKFRQEIVWEALLGEYRRLLEERAAPVWKPTMRPSWHEGQRYKSSRGEPV